MRLSENDTYGTAKSTVVLVARTGDSKGDFFMSLSIS